MATRKPSGAAPDLAELFRPYARMRTTFTEMNRVGEAMRKPGGAGTAMSPDALSKAFEKALATMREIAEIAEKANREALEAIGERSQAFQHELQAMIQPPAKGR